jgi:hypothetical protein
VLFRKLTTSTSAPPQVLPKLRMTPEEEDRKLETRNQKLETASQKVAN